jgi:lactoylglutathione lyase
MGLRIEVFPDYMDRCLDFYTQVLRFEITKDERDSEWPYVSLRRGSVHIGALKAWEQVAADRRRPPTGVEIVLEVDDVDAEEGAVGAAGWPVDEPITARPWGLRDFRILDPDGYYLRITDRAAARPAGTVPLGRTM